VTTLTFVSADPRTILGLSRVAAVVSEFFDLDPVVNYDTPFVWWDRSKRNYGISLPMPEPIRYGGDGRSPLFYQEQIIHWYGQWRGLAVPECHEAGDVVRSRGLIPSDYRK